MHAKDATITDSLLLMKAQNFADLLNVSFKPSNGWIYRWKKRQNIKFKNKHGEKNSVDKESAVEWIRNVLPQYLKDYSMDNIYNADESALLFKALSKGTLAYGTEQVAGRKEYKDRLTLLFICNATGCDKFIYAIGKSQKPRCFRNRTIPVKYYANKNAWMTQSIWSSIIIDLDKLMKRKNKKIVLFVDNASCHKIGDSITAENIKIVFLPPNATSLIQPLDQGIIRSFKAKYRQYLTTKQLLYMECGAKESEFSKTINIYEALQMSQRAWSNVSPTTIKNCFRKAQFCLDETSNDVDGDEDDIPLSILLG